jgi:hypothetical protein
MLLLDRQSAAIGGWARQRHGLVRLPRGVRRQSGGRATPSSTSPVQDPDVLASVVSLLVRHGQQRGFLLPFYAGVLASAVIHGPRLPGRPGHHRLRQLSGVLTDRLGSALTSSGSR